MPHLIYSSYVYGVYKLHSLLALRERLYGNIFICIPTVSPLRTVRGINPPNTLPHLQDTLLDRRIPSKNLAHRAHHKPPPPPRNHPRAIYICQWGLRCCSRDPLDLRNARDLHLVPEILLSVQPPLPGRGAVLPGSSLFPLFLFLSR